METDLLQSTSLKSGAKASHHAQNILRIRLLCQAQLVPFVQKKIAATSRKRASPDYTAGALLRQKKALTPHFPNDRPNAFKKLDHLSWLKRSCGWREPEVSPGKCREKNLLFPPSTHSEDKSSTLPLRNKWSYQSTPQSHRDKEMRARDMKRAKLRWPKTLQNKSWLF